MRSKWLLGLALAVVPAAFGARTALPGTVNYIEGQVTVNGKALSAAHNGETTLSAGQTLSVGTGKAEILLTPGAFVRVGNGGQVQMIGTSLSDPQVEIVHGEALVEVDYKPKMAHLDVREHGADTSLLKHGLYRFDADQAKVQVLDGKATVEEAGHNKDIGKGKELLLTSSTLKPDSFNWKSEDDLYRWSAVRDSYLAEASEASARNVYVSGGWGPGYGWYWNPYYSTYAWLPGDGYFWSPFGYPFFSPGYVVYAPRIRFNRFGGGFGGGRVFVPRAGVGRVAPAPRMSGRAGGFRR